MSVNNDRNISTLEHTTNRMSAMVKVKQHFQMATSTRANTIMADDMVTEYIGKDLLEIK